MIRQKEDNDNYFGLTVFIILFFLFISAFSDNSNTPVGRSLHYKTASDLHSQITALNDGQQIPRQKNAIRFIEKTDFNLSANGHKILADNRSVNHRLVYLQKAGLLIKPIILQRFCYRYHVIDSDDPPALS